MLEAKQSNPNEVGKEDDSTSPTTLYEAVLPECMDFATMKKQYPFVSTFKSLLGAAPNVLPVFLMFRGAFNAEAIGILSFINMPMAMFGLGPDFTSMSLAAFSASERAACTYCTLHCCSLLKRIGAADGLVARENRTPAQAASAALGAALGAMPAVGVQVAVREMRKHFSQDDVERHALFAGGMGFLNTFNDMLGTALEEGMINEAAPNLKNTGWNLGRIEVTKPVDDLQEVQKDFRNALGWQTKLEVLWNVPSSIMYEIRQTWGIPEGKKAVHDYLTQRLGGSLSVLDDIKFPNARKAVAMILRDHVAGEDCTYSRSFKYSVGKAFALCVGNEKLEKDMGNLLLFEKEKGNAGPDVGATEGLSELLKETSHSAAYCGADWTEKVVAMLRADKRVVEDEIPALMLCMSAFAQPFRTDAAIVDVVVGKVAAADIVEVVSWMGVLVMLNRMMSYYEGADSCNE